MRAGLRPGDVVEVHLAFRSAQQEEMPHFWVESYHLETRLLTADPTVDFLFREIAIVCSSSGVLRWWFNIRETLIVSVLLPMEGGIWLEVPLLLPHFLHLNLLGFLRL
jgi:hypothetical protein